MPLDPFSVAVPILELSWAGAKKGKAFKEAQKEIGTVISDALCLALCENGTDDKPVRQAAALIGEKLQTVPFPGTSKPSWVRQRTQALRARVPRVLRPRRIPAIKPYAHLSFDQRLTQWVDAVLDDGEVSEAVRRINCPDERLDRQAISQRFPHAFFEELHRGRETGWRKALLDALRESSESDRWARDELRRRQALRRSGIVAATGAIGFGGAEILGSDEISALGVAVATATASVLGIVAGMWQSRAGFGPARARSIVRCWLADLACATSGRPVLSTSAALHGWVRESVGDEDKITAQRELLDDLSRRLVGVARRSGDPRLEAALTNAEDAWLRHGRCSEANAGLMTSLAHLIELTESDGEAAME